MNVPKEGWGIGNGLGGGGYLHEGYGDAMYLSCINDTCHASDSQADPLIAQGFWGTRHQQLLWLGATRES